MGLARVLICESEGIFSLRFRRTLTRLGYEVIGLARDGNEAVQTACRLQPDAIIMDIDLLCQDGIAAAQTIRDNLGTAILIVSAYSREETVRAATAAGVAGYLVKPVTCEQIAEGLQTALRPYRASGEIEV